MLQVAQKQNSSAKYGNGDVDVYAIEAVKIFLDLQPKLPIVTRITKDLQVGIFLKLANKVGLINKCLSIT